MKRIVFSILSVLFIAFFIVCCDDENNDNNSNIDNINNDDLTITGSVIHTTDCKYVKSANLLSETPDSLSCVTYSYDYASNTLTIKHINAGFNCCPGELTCTVNLNSDTIVIEEFEKAPMCNCNCLFDLDIEINGVVKKMYTVKFIEPYAIDETEIVFELDLIRTTEGSYCVDRKNYPWNIY